MDKASLLFDTVPRKHQLTTQLEYNLVALTLIHQDLRSLALIPEQSDLKTDAFQSFLHLILSTLASATNANTLTA